MSNVTDVVAIGVQAGIPVHVVGDPGCGKTSFVRKLASILEQRSGATYPLHIIIPSLLDITDLQGMPYREGGALKWAPPYWTGLVKDGGLLYIDEANTATPAVQNACMVLVLEGRVGEVNLKCARILVTNPPEMVAGATPFSAPMANRLLHVKWAAPSADEWAKGMVNGWETSVPVLDHAAMGNNTLQYRAMIGSFARSKPDALFKFPADEAMQSGPWPSHRSWDMAHKALAAVTASYMTPGRFYAPLSDVAFLAVAGCVGDGGATEFMTWLRNANLPDPEFLLANPHTYRVPTRSDLIHAVVTSVAALAANTLTQSRWDAAWQVIMTTAAAGHKDAATISGILLAKANAARPVGDRFVPPAIVSELIGIASALTGLKKS